MATQRSIRTGIVAALLAGTLSAGASAQLLGPEWEEGINPPEAGSSPNTAQIPQIPGGGPLSGIRGRLSGLGPTAGGDFQDVYRIFIVDPAAFRATTVLAFNGEADFNTQLFLFDCDGFGLLANDDFSNADNRSMIQSASNDGTNVFLTDPGIYYLAITGFDSDAQAGGLDIFDMPPGSVEISGPDGLGGASPLTNWSQNGEIGEYRIDLVGCELFDALNPPCPGDVNGDFNVNVDDLLQLLAHWGPCPRPQICDVGFVCGGDPPVECSDDGLCFCFTSIDGEVICGSPPGQDCGDLQPCKSMEECPPGFACAIDTCCVQGICVIDCGSSKQPVADEATDEAAGQQGVRMVFGSMNSDHAARGQARSAATEPGCVGDLNFDGVVDVNDLLFLLANWGPCDCSDFSVSE